MGRKKKKYKGNEDGLSYNYKDDDGYFDEDYADESYIDDNLVSDGYNEDEVYMDADYDEDDYIDNNAEYDNFDSCSDKESSHDDLNGEYTHNSVYADETYKDEGYSDDEEFADDDFSDEEDYIDKSNGRKKKDNSIKGLLLVLGWVFLALLAVVFYFYFMDKLPDTKSKDDTTSEKEENSIYEINANEEINKLMEDYYRAIRDCDQGKLQHIVTNPSAFDDMTIYEIKAEVMTDYSNFTVYTLPGYLSSDTLVYVTCDITIADVESVCVNINQFYIVNTEDGYKIDNREMDEGVINYISEQSGKEEIQALYRGVYENIESCAANDPEFKAFAEEYGIIQ